MLRRKGNSNTSTPSQVARVHGLRERERERTWASLNHASIDNWIDAACKFKVAEACHTIKVIREKRRARQKQVGSAIKVQNLHSLSPVFPTHQVERERERETNGVLLVPLRFYVSNCRPIFELFILISRIAVVSIKKRPFRSINPYISHWR